MYAEVWHNVTSSSKKGAFQTVYPQAKLAWHKIKLRALRLSVMRMRRSVDSEEYAVCIWSLHKPTQTVSLWNIIIVKIPF